MSNLSKHMMMLSGNRKIGSFLWSFVFMCITLLFFQKQPLHAQVLSNNGAAISVGANSVLKTKDIVNTAGTISNADTVILSGTYLNGATTNGNGIFHIGGDWTNNTGTLTLGTSTFIFDGPANQLITRTGGETFYNFTINNAGTPNTITLGSALTVNGSATFSNGQLVSAYDINFNGTTIGGTGNISASAGTVTYSSTATNIIPGTYFNLTLTGASTKTLYGNVIVTNNLTISDGTLQLADKNITVLGTTSVTGTIADNNSLGVDTFGGLVTINPGGTWDFSAGNSACVFKGGLAFNGTTFNSGTGTYSFTTNNQNIDGSSPITFSGNILIASTISVTNLNASSGTGTTIKGSLDGVYAASTYINKGITSYQNASSPMSPGTLDPSANGNIFRYSGGTQTISGDNPYYNLVITGTNSKTFNSNITVGGDLTIQNNTTITFGGGSIHTLDITGNLDASAGNIDMNNGSQNHILILRGINDSCKNLITANQSIVEYLGGDGQQVFSSANYRNILFGGSGTKVMQGDVTALGNTITLSANVKTDTFTLFFNNGSGTVTRTAGAVAGNFKQAITSTAVTYLFPVGTLTSYNPFKTTFTNLTNGSLLVYFNTADIGNAGLPLNDSGDEVYDRDSDGYWTLKALNSLASTNYAVNLNYSGFTAVNNASRILKRTDGANLVLDGIHGTVINPEITRTNLTGISTNTTDLAIGKGRPRIVTQPINDTVCDNSIAVFSVVATGQGTLTYKWQENKGSGFADITNGGIYSGATSDHLSITNASLSMSGYTYRCIVSDGPGDPNTSNSAILIVKPIPIISLTQTSDTICNNTNEIITPSSSVAGSTFTWTISADAGINGASAGNGLLISQTLTNSNSFAAKVIYTIKPVGPVPTHCNGASLNDTIWVEPVVTITAPNDTICNNTSTSITPTTIFTTTHGIKLTWSVTDDGSGKITGFSDNNIGLAIGNSISQTLANSDTLAHFITYTIIPHATRGNGSLYCAGIPFNEIVWINPTPRIRISDPDTVICNNTSTTIAVRNPNTTLQGAWKYDLTIVKDAAITGNTPNQTYTSPTNLTETLANSDTLVHKITYAFTPRITPNDGGADCLSGVPQSITIWVNPTPRIRVSAPDTVICNNTSTTITIRNPNTPIRGTWNYNLIVTPDTHITGAQGSAVNSNILSFTNTLVNSDTIVHKVIYHFKPNIFNDDGTPPASCASVDTNIVIWVNPTPRIRVSAPDTVICNNTSTTITIRNPNTPIRGTWNYNLIVTPDTHITGAQGSAVNSNILSFTNTLVNSDTIVHKVIYHFKPNIFNDDGTPPASCASVDTNIVIWVNPTPRIRVSAPDTVICNNTSTTITIRNPNTPIRGTWNYNLTVTPDTHITGAQGSAVNSNILSFTNTLVNSDTIVHKVIYHFKPNIFNDDGTPPTSCASIDTNIVIWVNPTPRIRVSAPDTVICNNTSTTITIRNPNTPIRGTWNYNLTVTPDTHITGAQGSAVNSNILSFTNTLVNSDTIVHKVIYHFKPNIFNDDGTPPASCASVDTNIVIWVNPTPRIRVSAPDTVICNNTSTTITIRNPNTPIRGTWNYNLTVTPDTHITGAEPNHTGVTTTSYTNTLSNNDTIVHKVVYFFKPNIFNDDGTPVGSCTSKDTTIIIWVNPTPRIRVSAPDTVICNNTATTITIRNPNTPIRGTWNYNLTVTPDTHITGAQGSAVNSNILSFTNTLVNSDTIVHKVIYHFKPNIFNDDGTPPASCASVDTNIVIWVNPTPRIRVSAPDTVICNNTATTITIRNPNTPIRGTWNYNLTVTPDTHITGAQGSAVNSNILSFTNTLVNSDTIVHKVIYHFKPNIFNDDGTPPTSCASVDTNIVIWVNPTPRIRVSAPDTVICNNTATTITIRNPNTPIRGTWNYNLIVTPDTHITGAEPNHTGVTTTSYTNTLSNNDTIVHKVVYFFKPNIFNDDGTPVGSCTSKDTTIIIWVNPTPRIRVSAPDTVICNNTATTITIRNPNTPIRGTWNYNLTVTPDTHITGAQGSAVNSNILSFTNTLVNSDTIVHKIIYHFKPNIFNDDGTPPASCASVDTNIVIWVNPTPRIRVSAPDTVICNNTSTTITIRNPNTPIRGTWNYNLTVTPDTHITGAEPNHTGVTTTSYTNTLSNNDTIVHKVVYFFKPNIFNDDGTPVGSCTSKDTTIIIWVNPTPRIRVSAPDTVICNNTATTITIRNPNTPIRGTWNYNLTVTPDTHITGAQGSAVNSNILSFTNTLVNSDTIVHKVIYHFKPNIFNDDGTPPASCASVDTNIVIWVNPTPRIRVSAPDTVICNNTSTTITIRNPNTPIRGTWNYNLTVTPDTHITGAQGSAVNSNILSFTNTLVNSDTIVHKVIYHFKPNIFNDDGTPPASCASVDTNIVIWVNPTPRIRVSAPDTVICNNTSTTITIRNPNTPIRGTWNYNLTVTPDTHITGAQGSAVNSNILSFTNTLVNSDTIVHKVIYHFKPNIFNDDGTPVGSCTSKDTTIIIWVNPTPRIRVSAPDTVICNNTSTTITIRNPNTPIRGTWNYNLTVTPDTHITGAEPNHTGVTTTSYTNTLSNNDTIVHKVVYFFKPNIFNDDGTPVGSCTSKDTTIIIWVNPTPRIRVSAPDTVICNNTATTITIRNPNTPIRGTWNYNLTVTPDTHITGAQGSAVNSNILSFTNTLVNSDTIVHKVIYHFKPNIFNDDGTPPASCASVDTNIVIWVNPTPRIRVSAPDTVICNNTATTITIRNPNTPIRGTWNYNLTVTPDTHITGAEPSHTGVHNYFLY